MAYDDPTFMDPRRADKIKRLIAHIEAEKNPAAKKAFERLLDRYVNFEVRGDEIFSHSVVK